MINSKQKGKRGERELAGILREYGFDSRRGQQYCGANGDADVVGLPGIHIEVKRVERLNISEAIRQSQKDAMPEEIPTVFHRRNKESWLVTMPLTGWMELYQRFVACTEKTYIVNKCQGSKTDGRK